MTDFCYKQKSNVNTCIHLKLSNLSLIRKHLQTHTQFPAPIRKSVGDNTGILRTTNCKSGLKITGAYYIKTI